MSLCNRYFQSNAILNDRLIILHCNLVILSYDGTFPFKRAIIIIMIVRITIKIIMVVSYYYYYNVGMLKTINYFVERKRVHFILILDFLIK